MVTCPRSPSAAPPRSRPVSRPGRRPSSGTAPQPGARAAHPAPSRTYPRKCPPPRRAGRPARPRAPRARPLWRPPRHRGARATGRVPRFWARHIMHGPVAQWTAATTQIRAALTAVYALQVQIACSATPARAPPYPAAGNSRTGPPSPPPGIPHGNAAVGRGGRPTAVNDAGADGRHNHSGH